MAAGVAVVPKRGHRRLPARDRQDPLGRPRGRPLSASGIQGDNSEVHWKRGVSLSARLPARYYCGCRIGQPVDADVDVMVCDYLTL